MTMRLRQIAAQSTVDEAPPCSRLNDALGAGENSRDDCGKCLFQSKVWGIERIETNCCKLRLTCVAMMTMRASGAAHAISRAM